MWLKVRRYHTFKCSGTLATSAAAPRYLRAKIALHIQQQPLKWLDTKIYFLQCLSFAETNILVLQEMFLKVDKYIFIPGKIIYRLDRSDGLGGGLLIAVNSSFPSTRKDISVGNANAEIKGIQITLDLLNLKLLICTLGLVWLRWI